MNCQIILAAFLLLLSLHAGAEAVRSVDEAGNITFSDKPAQGSVESDRIRINAPPPPQERMTESQREAQATIDRANHSQQQRDAESQLKQSEVSSARQNLENARKQLEEAKIVGEGDRIGTIGAAGSGSRLTDEHLDRVKRAEQAVSEAEQRLRETR